MFKSKLGPGFGTVVGTSFDSFASVDIEDGIVSFSADLFSAAVPGSYALKVTGGMVSISASNFAVGGTLDAALIQISQGSVAVTGSFFEANGFDATIIKETSGSLSLTGNKFLQTPNKIYKTPLISIEEGRVSAENNTISDKGIGAGIFIVIQHDNPFNRFVGNVSPGWPAYFPRPMHGTYVFD